MRMSVAILFILLSIISTTLSIPLLPVIPEGDHRPQTHIVHVARSEKPYVFTSHHHWYTSILNSLNHPPPKLLYTYVNAINGFSATLTPYQATKLQSRPGILSVLRGKTHKLATTHTYKFLGLSEKAGLWPSSNYGENVIIGVIDTGVWPEHRSFSDDGMYPVPSSWKGQCETSDDFPASLCNNKIIGARAFYVGSSKTGPRTVRDNDGHGSIVASIAAGSMVTNASYYSFGEGAAYGVAPKARIAVYKVCPFHYCDESDILAGVEQAIADEVDVISFSLAGGTEPYFEDNFAVATFGAMQNGIVFSTVAGNEGPEPETVNHLAPWALTVGASSVDREFRADVFLGDGKSYIGESLYYGKPLFERFYGLAYGADFGNRLCEKGKFVRASELARKIIFCDGEGYLRSQSEAVLSVNGVGMIVTNMPAFGEELRADPVYFAVPTTMVSQLVGQEIKKYIKNTPKPKAYIASFGTVVGEWPTSPKVAAFSSRGPNPITPQILKPDLIAPGLNILGAWTRAKSPTMSISDPRRVEFNVQSGTSLACPHVSGLAALLRSAHPKWSTSAIKSALMTTSYDLDNFGSTIRDLATEEKSTPYVHGAGHVNPNRAADPGLIYDMGVKDYVAFLCSIGYDSNKIKIFLKEDVSSDVCDGVRGSPGDLNYPSFSVVFEHGNDSVTYRRTVTNVGDSAEVVYKVSVNAPKGVEISVSPEELVFDADTSTNMYDVTFRSSGEYSESAKFGSIEWSDEEHRVRSPVAFSWTSISPTSSYMLPSTI